MFSSNDARACKALLVVGSGLLAGCIAVPESTSEWTQWRGPDRAARASGFVAPEPWPAELTKVWSVEVGGGLASPIVADEKVWLLTRDGDDEVVSCFRLADGERLWSQRYTAPFFANSGATSPRRYPVSKGKGPFATPALHEGRVYTLGVDRTLSSFDAETGRPGFRNHYLKTGLPGQVSWVCPPCGCSEDGKSFDEPGVCPACGMAFNPADLETSARQGGGNYYGAAASPLFVDDLGIVHVGNLTKSVLIAFDRISGDERWRLEAPTIAYASPVLADLHGVRQLVTLTRESVLGVSLTGELLWSHPLSNNAHQATPVVHGDLVIAASYRGPLFAVRVVESAGAWSAELAWENAEMTLWLASPVLDGDRLYGFFFSNKGQFGCLDVNTGETLWASDGRQGESATLVATEKELIAVKNDGTLAVFAKSAESFEPIREYEVADSPIWTYPAIVGKNIVIKDARRLTLWRAD